MPDKFAQSSAIFLSNTDVAYDECASGISNLDKIIVSVSSRFSSMTRGYLLPIVYAYWERFFRVVFSEYLRCVEINRIGLNLIHPQLAQMRLKKELNDVLNYHKIRQLQEVASRLDIEAAQRLFDNMSSLFHKPVVFSDPSSWIETESNVNFNVLRDNCRNFGIDIDSIKSRLEESKITLFSALKDLVDARNQISHGETFREIDSTEWETLKNYILTVMNAVQIELFETLRSGHCLR